MNLFPQMPLPASQLPAEQQLSLEAIKWANKTQQGTFKLLLL